MKNYLAPLALLLISTMPGQIVYSQYYPDQIKAEDRICFALYTVHENTLKLTAQFYPIQDYEPFEAILQIKKDEA